MAISPMQPEPTRRLVEQLELGFPVLCDPGNLTAAAFHLTHTLSNDLRQAYLELGIDLPACNGDPSWVLPLPARYLVDAEGIIATADVSVDHTVRSDPAETLAALLVLD